MKMRPVLRMAWPVILGIVLTSSLLIPSLILKPARAAGPWYVAPDGSDGNSCQSAGSPCATINGAIGKASSGDTVYVATGVYTSSAGSEVVLINKSITLSGGWDATFANQSGLATIDGDGVRRGITINSSLTVTIEHFVIQNGSSTYGIESMGTLTMNNSTVSDNNEGGIYNGGSLTLNYSTVSDNLLFMNSGGGAIFSQGPLTLNFSNISGNSGPGIISESSLLVNRSVIIGNGKGIDSWLAGPMILNNSIVSGNVAVGIENHVDGTLNNTTVSGNSLQGIFNEGTLILNNSTVSGNTNPYQLPGGGGILNYGSLTLNSSTVSGNNSFNLPGGGIYNHNNAQSTVTLRNSIVAGNSSDGIGPDCYGTISSGGYNLIGNITDCIATGDTTGNLTGVNPLLGPLQDNGGPTPTQALLLNSPAIDAGNLAGCTDSLGNLLTTDQRGVARVGRCDIGAYEYDLFQQVYLPLIYTHASCAPFFSDDFSNPASGWPVGDDGDNLYEYESGEYRILVRPDQWGAVADPGFQASDYSASVNLRNPNGVYGSYGLAFGIADDGSTFYTLEIFPDGWYGIYRYDPSDVVPLSETFSPALHQGTASNLIKVERTGATINAYANGQLLASVTDGTYTGSRYIGLVVFSYNQPNVDIRFDNFAVYPASCAGTGAGLSTNHGGSPSPGQRFFYIDGVEKSRSKRQR